MGLSYDQKYAVQIYWIESRQAKHQHREFIGDINQRSIQCQSLDTIPEGELSELEYTVMLSCGRLHIVSNGPQTELLANLCVNANLSYHVGKTTQMAPGKMSSTRITGVTDIHRSSSTHFLCAITPSENIIGEVVYKYPCKELAPGFGYCITTYSRTNSSLIPFSGKPHLLALPELTDNLEEVLWDCMPPNLRAGIVIKKIDLIDGTISVRWRNRGLYT